MAAVDRMKVTAGAVFAVLLLVMGLGLGQEGVVQDVAGDLIIGLGGGQAVQLSAVCWSLAIALVAGAQLVFMVLVADVACPDAPMVITGPAKLIAGVITWGSLLAAVVSLAWPQFVTGFN